MCILHLSRVLPPIANLRRLKTEQTGRQQHSRTMCFCVTVPPPETDAPDDVWAALESNGWMARMVLDVERGPSGSFGISLNDGNVVTNVGADSVLERLDVILEVNGEQVRCEQNGGRVLSSHCSKTEPPPPDVAPGPRRGSSANLGLEAGSPGPWADWWPHDPHQAPLFPTAQASASLATDLRVVCLCPEMWFSQRPPHA